MLNLSSLCLNLSTGPETKTFMIKKLLLNFHDIFLLILWRDPFGECCDILICFHEVLKFQILNSTEVTSYPMISFQHWFSLHILC